MKKLSDLLKPYDDLLVEMDIPGIELNFNHYMEIGKGNEDCIYGFYWLMSYNATGHAHIVLIPQIGMPLERWPVAFYDDENGTAQIFASSLKTWFPSYLLYKFNSWYPIYQRRGDGVKWVNDVVSTWKSETAQIVEHGKKFMPDFPGFFGKLLALVDSKAVLGVFGWWVITEKGTFLAEYYDLKATNANAATWKAYIRKYPFYNRPLGDALLTEGVKRDNVDPALDADLCREYFGRFWKVDVPSYKVVPAIVKKICSEPAHTDFPFRDFVQKIHEVTKDDPFGYYHGTEEFQSLAERFLAESKYALSIRCAENSIFMGRGETEEYNEAAHEVIVQAAEKLGDAHYLAYVAETLDAG